eukprot:TRINITY_DN28035_c0_g1_i1.p1 TRINITY_DN28035_c0_g1~~TRINITY_DN28035_c0_g1_i1.p1  ORF type:complete len:805 (+),score=210.63 TRINITY_DN28035_c0_g1_i1:23-2437(+)
MASDAATGQKERLDLQDFATSSGDQAFDPVLWLNARLAKSSVPFDKLDQHLSSLGMSCQLLCQDTSEAIEVASNQLVAQISPSSRDLERMRQDALKGKAKLTDVLAGLKDADDKKRSGLQGLADIDAVKTRVEVACSALREIGSWDRKIRDCEQLVHSGTLPAALGQLNSLKGVLDAFKMLPEYTRKEEQLSQLEEQLVNTARRRARSAVERNVADDLGACREVFAWMHKPEESASIVVEVFLQLVEKAWKNNMPQQDASAAELATAVRAVFEALAQALQERSALLEALEAAPQPAAGADSTTDVSSSQPPTAPVLVTVPAVKAALVALGKKVGQQVQDGKTSQADEVALQNKASRAVALLGVYVDGFAALAESTPLADRWLEVCKETRAAQQEEVLPWPLVGEVVRFVVLQPILDDGAALAPPTQQMRPSEAVLAAESNATRLLQMSSTWARRLEQQGAAQLAVPWLACVDEANSSYWRQWDRLIGTFQNTLQLKRSQDTGDGAAGYDSALLQECMQLHRILHDSLPSKFAAFQAETLQHVKNMQSSMSGPGLSDAFREKMRSPDVWCNRLAIPSAASLRAAADAVDRATTDASQALSASSAALAKAEQEVRKLVTQCCALPVANILKAYPDMQEWTRIEDANSDIHLAAGMSLPCITQVGEHLFQLVPQLEQSQENSQLQWLPTILEAVVDAAVQKVLQIKQLSPCGAEQLAVDLEYLRKVTDALGNSGAGAAAPEAGAQIVLGAGAGGMQLQELLQAVAFLGPQLRRKKEAAAKGEPFIEEACPNTLSRWAERPLRLALGL